MLIPEENEFLIVRMSHFVHMVKGYRDAL